MKDKLYAIICEGASEHAIIDILLDANKLKFNRLELLYGEVSRKRAGKQLLTDLLRFRIDALIIYRILDSKKEQFKIPKSFDTRVEIIDCYTRPEIEILIIINEGKWDDYQKKKNKYGKPSEYVMNQLPQFRRCRIKSYDFVRDYFSDVEKLINTLINYEKLTSEKGESIVCLIK